MGPLLALKAAELAGTAITGMTGEHYAKKVASAQRETAALQYKLNKKQVEEAYQAAFMNSMDNFVDSRQRQIDEYEDMSSKITMFTGSYDTSYEGDARAELDLEFNNNLQTVYGNLINQTSELASNKTFQSMKLGESYLTQKDQISQTLSNVHNKMINDIAGKAMALGESAVGGYQDAKAKDSTITFGKFFKQGMGGR